MNGLYFALGLLSGIVLTVVVLVISACCITYKDDEEGKK